MSIEDFDLNISRFGELLQRITANMASGVILERVPPLDLWNMFEADLMVLRDLAGRLKETMLFLNPERVPTIERRFRALMQPINGFKDILFQKSEEPLANSRLALEQLRKALIEGSDFLDLTKEMRNNPSKGISEVLKLREIYKAKEYVSSVSIPETVYARFAGLRRNLESLKLRVSDLERAIGELSKSIENVQEEIAKFRPVAVEQVAEKEGSEPSLVVKDKKESSPPS